MLTGQHVALDDMLTGRENLVMFGRLQGLKKPVARSRAEQLLDQLDIVHAADRKVSTYSGGCAVGSILPADWWRSSG
jgi:ABC-2 type transport system ATP-binding protein